MKKVFQILALSLASVMLLTACGKESSKGETTTAVNGGSSDTDYSAMTLPELFSQYDDQFRAKEHLTITDAMKIVGETEKEEALKTEITNVLENMEKCQSVYIQEKGESDSTYTASFEFYVEYGTPRCSTEYTGFIGNIGDSAVNYSTDDEEYLFKLNPKGFLASSELDFEIWIGNESAHIMWGDSCDYELSKTDKSLDQIAAEDEEAKVPFSESESYATIMETCETIFGDREYSASYDEDSRTLFIYLIPKSESRQWFLDNAAQLEGIWDPLLESLTDITDKLAQIVTVGIRDEIYDISEAHCTVTLVTELMKNSSYTNDKVLAVITDGEIKYNLLDSSASSSSSSKPSSKKEESSKPAEKPAQKPAQNSQNQNTGSGSGSGSATRGEKNALQKAYDYLSFTAFSYSGLIEQLEYEGYSHSEAVYAADHCGADWDEQAYLKAVDYLDYMPFSYSELVEQLEYEGFTSSQAEYGAKKAY